MELGKKDTTIEIFYAKKWYFEVKFMSTVFLCNSFYLTSDSSFFQEFWLLRTRDDWITISVNCLFTLFHVSYTTDSELHTDITITKIKTGNLSLCMHSPYSSPLKKIVAWYFCQNIATDTVLSLF